MAYKTNWTIEARRRLNGTRIGRGQQYANTEMHTARQCLAAALNKWLSLPSWERGNPKSEAAQNAQARIQTCCKQFDRALKQTGHRLGTSASLRP